MTVAAETYTQLMSDPAHLGFEMTLTIIQDVLIGLVLWPLIKRVIRRHDRKTHKIEEEKP